MAINLTSEKIGSWKEFHLALLAELENLPFLSEQHARLTALIEEAERLQVEQKSLQAALQILNQRRYDLALEGDDMCRRLGAALQSQLGFKNEKLIAFGIKPRPTTRRRRKAGEETEESGAE